jgi:hypothetical protein
MNMLNLKDLQTYDNTQDWEFDESSPIIIARDPIGARRIWRQAHTEKEAMDLILEDVGKYLAERRPDLGPLDQWTFRLAIDADLIAVHLGSDVPGTDGAYWR